MYGEENISTVPIYTIDPSFIEYVGVDRQVCLKLIARS